MAAASSADAASGQTSPGVAVRPRMLYSLEQPYALADRSLALETYYHDQLAIASAPDGDDVIGSNGLQEAGLDGNSASSSPGTTTPKIPDYLANELVASLELLRHPLPLTLRTNEASNRGGEAAIAALDAALGGYGGGSSGGGIRRLQPIPWFSNAWQVGACPGNSNSNSSMGATTGAATAGEAEDLPLSSITNAVDANRVTELLIRLQKCGEVAQQEHGSMLPAHCLAPVRPHHAVLDLCAAPGSKTLQLLDAMHAPSSCATDCATGSSSSSTNTNHLYEKENSAEPSSSMSQQRPSGLLIANEIEAKRCTKLRDRASSQPASCLVTTTCDAREFPSLCVAKDEDSNNGISGFSGVFPKLRFDRILCDVPCSGDGALRKSPMDLPLWQPQAGLGEHPRQLAILMRGLELLAPGGKLVYSTCSLNPIENEAVVAATLEASHVRNLRVRLLPLPAPLFAATATTVTNAAAADTKSSASSTGTSTSTNTGITSIPANTAARTASASNTASSSSTASSTISSVNAREVSGSSSCPRWAGWDKWGVPNPSAYAPEALMMTTRRANNGAGAPSTLPSGAGAGAGAAAAASIGGAATGIGGATTGTAAPRLFVRFEDVPQELMKGGGTKKAPLLPSMFPPPDVDTRNALRERCGRIMPSKSANCGGFFVAIFTRDTKSGPAATEWEQVWRPKSSSASSTASSSFLQQPPPSASSSSDGTPKSNGEGSATGAEIEAPTGKKRVRDDECDGNDIGERVKLNGVTATEVQGAKGGEVEPKGKQQRSRKRNKMTQTRVDVERRPCFLPLMSVDQQTAEEIATFFGLVEDGIEFTESVAGSAFACASANGVSQDDNMQDEVSSSCSSSALLSSLAVGSYHKDRSMIYTCSPGALTLQAHASLHVASFGEPFAKRMSAEAAHWWPVQDAPWRPCHEAASIFGTCASKRRLWLRKPSSLTTTTTTTIIAGTMPTVASSEIESIAAGALETTTSNADEITEDIQTQAKAVSSSVDASSWKQDPWRTLLIKRRMPASVLQELASSGDLRGFEGCCGGTDTAVGAPAANTAVGAAAAGAAAGTTTATTAAVEGASNTNNSSSSSSGIGIHNILAPGGVVVSFFEDDEKEDHDKNQHHQQLNRLNRPWLVGLLESSGGLLLLAEGDVLRRHLLD